MAEKSLSDLRQELKQYLTTQANKSIEEVCNKYAKILKEYIWSDYYAKYNPKLYDRTEQFLNSAASKMVKECVGQVYVNEDSMHYKNNYWTGEWQALMASEGYHGSFDIQREGEYWNSFLNYFYSHIYSDLRTSFIRNGIPVK